MSSAPGDDQADHDRDTIVDEHRGNDPRNPGMAAAIRVTIADDEREEPARRTPQDVAERGRPRRSG
jgi:hypothetical protein